MELIKYEIMERLLNEFVGMQFTTQDFVHVFKKQLPDIYNTIVIEFGSGGKGSGRNYSSNVHIGKSISKHRESTLALTFITDIKAPKAWGNPVIPLWDYNPNNIETVRFGTSIENDISDLLDNDKISGTDREALVLSRIGQGEFRKKLIKYWKHCAVTHCKDTDLLIASHIKPWSKSSNIERLDVYNGLLLTPNIDRLFDRGYVSFSDKGKILISNLLPNNTKKQFGIDKGLCIKMEENHIKYMEHHREYVFRTTTR
ncbi:HNH endonuclease [Desulfobotulus mexicanus]|uniref:HNH nuclease domain-containing protein n=1 Tax=Desulfobotulus mexicanus TaxID=2586642 RepID=A0A5S5MFI2_9BACT|nr:HNH endonuclease [Desulfobotulus mexicanus]TYT74491.1 hypothetical protein FIM25_10080 [Desulfobotulus mexicanus]